jgi:cytochrome P450
LRTAPVTGVRRLLADGKQRGWLDAALAYGPTFRYQRLVATADPAVVEPLLTDPVHTQRRSRSHVVVSAITPGSAGLLFMDGERWRRRARAAAPVFSRAHFEQFGAPVQAAVAARVERWAAGQDVDDLARAVTRLGADLVLRIGYGLDPADRLAARLGEQLVGYKLRTMSGDPRQRLDQFGYTAAKLLDLPWAVQTYLELRERVGALRGTVGALLGRRGRPPGRANWIDAFDAAGLTLPELTDELNHLYGAYNAVDFAIAAALFELSRHREWRARVRAEVDATLDDSGPPTREQLARLTDTTNVMREVLRRYPVAMCVFRRLGAPLDVGGERLPRGAEVAILPYALHHHPDYWEEPARFDPDRWRRDPEPRVPFSYIPFLVGPRQCMGRHLAEWVFLVVVATIVRRADLEVLVDGADLTEFVVPRFGAPLPFRVTPR